MYKRFTLHIIACTYTCGTSYALQTNYVNFRHRLYKGRTLGYGQEVFSGEEREGDEQQ